MEEERKRIKMKEEPYTKEIQIPVFDHYMLPLKATVTEEGWKTIRNVIMAMHGVITDLCARPRLELSPKGVTVSNKHDEGTMMSSIEETRVVICGPLSITILVWVARVGPVTFTLNYSELGKHFEG